MYIVEGNMGAGKSTFLNLLEKYVPQVSVSLEPVHNWQSIESDESLLANFYQHPQRWAYTLETFTMMCRVREHIKDQIELNKPKIVERSIYSGHYCFAQNSYENGYLTDLEWKLYNEWFNFLIPNTCRAPQGFIYLRVDPIVSFERVKKRNRAGEETMTMAYLQQTHERHESFLIKNKANLPMISAIPVLVLDCNEEFEKNETKLQEHIAKVKQFIADTQATFKPATADWDMLRRMNSTIDEKQGG